jgi:hypothetical protein
MTATSTERVQNPTKTFKWQTIAVFDRVVDNPSGPVTKGPKMATTVLSITKMGIVYTLQVLGGFIPIGKKKLIVRQKWSRVIHRFISRKPSRLVVHLLLSRLWLIV